MRELDVITPRRAHRWASTTPGAEIGPPDNWGRNLRLDAVAAPPASSSSSRAPSAALRWIARLTEAGFFERRPDPFDRRRAFMSLTERGLDAMRRYVAMARALGLPVV